MRTLAALDAYPAPTELALGEEAWAFYCALPPDHRALLAATNGGLLEDAAYGFDTGVPAPDGAGSGTDHLRELYGLRGRHPGDGPRDLLAVRAECEAEGFLPRGVLAIAAGGQGSLVCLSLRPERYGEVLYWDRYWQAPWCHPHFQARIDAVLALHPDAPEVLDTPGHPDAPALADALNFATLVTLAPRLGPWLATLRDARRASWI